MPYWGKEFLISILYEDGTENVKTYSPHILFRYPLFGNFETLELPE